MTIPAHWRMPAVQLTVGLLAVLALYWQSAYSIGYSWYAVPSFSHGYLIVPISLYIIWTRRQQLVAINPSMSLWVGLAILPVSVAWAMADVLSVQLGLFVGLFLQIGLLCWGLLGHKAFKVIAAPVIYLSLALPIWGHLTPWLQKDTADAAVFFLRMLGVPVFHEGYFIVIPEGTFIVAEVCAGLRFFLATLSICGFFSMLNFTLLRTGLIFLAISIAISIVSNWVRVVIIVVAGHITDMKSPLVEGEGHIMFGWVIFAVALVPIFMVGNKLQAREEGRLAAAKEADGGAEADGTDLAGQTGPAAAHTSGRRNVWLMALVAFAALGPLLATTASHQSTAAQGNPTWGLNPVIPASGWRKGAELAWDTRFQGADTTFKQTFEDDEGGQVGLFVAAYRTQTQGKELISESNQLYSRELWGPPRAATRISAPAGIQGEGRALNEVAQTNVSRDQRGRLIWHWYVVTGRTTASRNVAKLLPLTGIVSNAPPAVALVAVTASYETKPAEAAERLGAFLRHNYPAIEAGLRAAGDLY